MSSSSSSSSKNSCLAETKQENCIHPLTKVPENALSGLEELHHSDSPVRSFFDSHLKHLRDHSERESDPFRFMKVYKQKYLQQQSNIHHEDLEKSRRDEAVEAHLDHSDSSSAYDMDKTSEAASSIPSLVEEVNFSQRIHYFSLASLPTGEISAK